MGFSGANNKNTFHTQNEYTKYNTIVLKAGHWCLRLQNKPEL